MRLDKRVAVDAGGIAGGGRDGALPLIAAICMGSACFVLLSLVSVCLLMRRRNSRRLSGGAPAKQYLLPKTARPVMSFKTAAGPGGLKKSPSPATSPDDADWVRCSHVVIGQQHRLDESDSSTSMEHVERVSMKDVSPQSDAPAKGELNYSLRYSFDKNALQVNIASATNLPPTMTAEQQLMDPYVKLQLLPEKQHKVKTRVVRNTLNPVYDEEFTFYGINYNQLQSTTLHFAVVAFDRYSRDEIIGEVICPLHAIELANSDQQASLSVELTSRSSKFQNTPNRGELLVSLCYQPATNKITAVILKAKNLPKFDITGLADPYVKMYMLYNGAKVAKKKTHVKKRTLAPVYNESFVFDLPTSDPGALELVGFELLLVDWDRVTKNEVMGRCSVGPNAAHQAGRDHWDQVRRNPRRQIAEWHRLRP